MIWLYRKKKAKVWRMTIKGQNIERKKGEQEEVKQISEWNIIQRSLLKQSSYHLFGCLLSFTPIPLALATIQA